MKPLLVITGPTASGKSNLALHLAKNLGGEIVSCDSMQIYRGCDIATAKPTPLERARIPHHLLDVCDPDERFSAAQWAIEAREAIENIEKGARTPIVCGGTGFYLRALLQPQTLAEVAPDAALRAQLEAELETRGALAMHETLAETDAKAAARLHPNDSFRVLRALEVALGEKNALSSPETEWAPLIFALDWPREVLYHRINERVEAMMEAGFLEELQFLAGKWGRDAPALGGVGYKQMMPVLDDESNLSECLEAWKRDTRRYAKRQRTWFRHQLPVRWLDGAREAQELAGDVARVFLDGEKPQRHGDTEETKSFCD
ncbi:MAG: tRNA (adenosine(37)-N6)-dimethylallyltransferase MiaA [Armatimonadetes bacterium]|nr:tRNA (adenosine(37)-N6)-dimethylallyltransferase MiaA [Armatimonadota bacterium]